MERSSSSVNFASVFTDQRLAKRATAIYQSLLMARNSSVHMVTKDEAEQRGFYRFLLNKKTTEALLIEELINRCKSNIINRDIICIQDTTSCGFSRNAKNIKKESGVGFVGNKLGVGFLLHPSLVLDANSEAILGFGDVHIWHREKAKANNTTRLYKKEPIEQKESYRWITASNACKTNLSAANSITIIQDREGDIFEQFDTIPDKKTTLIIRNRVDRNLKNGEKLYKTFGNITACEIIEVQIAKDSRKGTGKRTARCEVKYLNTFICKPSNLNRKDIATSIAVNYVEVKEIGYKGKDPICWRLATTQQMQTMQDALEIVRKYKLRWYIEQLFRMLKKEGFNIEKSELETGWSLRKLVVLILGVSIRLMQLYLAYDDEEGEQLVTEIFIDQEIVCLEKIKNRLENETPNKKNPYSKTKATWASWIIARLGGWKGGVKCRRPGPIVFKRGLEKFMAIYQGYKLALEIT